MIMSTHTQRDDQILGDPIELISRFAVQQDWYLKQTSAHEVLADVPGHWGHYQLYVEWLDDVEALHVEAQLDALIEDVSVDAVQTVLCELNEALFLGHFQLTADRRQIVLRYKLPLRGAGGVSPEQIEDVVDIILGQCEKAAPVLCQLIYCQGQYEAGSASLMMLKTLGEA